MQRPNDEKCLNKALDYSGPVTNQNGCSALLALVCMRGPGAAGLDGLLNEHLIFFLFIYFRFKLLYLMKHRLLTQPALL